MCDLSRVIETASRRPLNPDSLTAEPVLLPEDIRKLDHIIIVCLPGCQFYSGASVSYVK